MRCVKSPVIVSLKQEYQKWKVQSRKCTDKAREEWREQQQAEGKHISSLSGWHTAKQYG